MYMLKSVVSVALFAAYAVAQTTTLAFTSFPTSVEAGQSYTVTWAGGDSTQPVTITLREGDSNNLQTVGVLTSTATGGSYTWVVDSSIANAPDYALEISQGTVVNYSAQFPVTGGTGTLTTASTTASASASASAASTSGSASASASASAKTSASASASAAASSTLSSTTSASKTSSTASTTSAPSSGANGLQSPIALILGAVAAMFYLA